MCRNIFKDSSKAGWALIDANSYTPSYPVACCHNHEQMEGNIGRVYISPSGQMHLGKGNVPWVFIFCLAGRWLGPLLLVLSVEYGFNGPYGVLGSDSLGWLHVRQALNPCTLSR